jgi:F0F1-type ATP synthase membrane subunit c/vacuolar-type H+-ATPase subunit K
VPARAPASPAFTARIIHGALVMGVLLFWAAVWYLGTQTASPASALPSGPLYLALIMMTAVSFAGAALVARSIAAPATGTTQDEWWQRNLGRAIVVWALVEAPSLFGLVVYLTTGNQPALVVTLAGLLLFAVYRPSRLPG